MIKQTGRDGLARISPYIGHNAGPGAFDFKQGDTKGTVFWKAVGHFLSNPSQEQIDCQAPKPILLNTGEAKLPYDWYNPTQHHPHIDLFLQTRYMVDMQHELQNRRAQAIFPVDS